MEEGQTVEGTPEESLPIADSDFYLPYGQRVPQAHDIEALAKLLEVDSLRAARGRSALHMLDDELIREVIRTYCLQFKGAADES